MLCHCMWLWTTLLGLVAAHTHTPCPLSSLQRPSALTPQTARGQNKIINTIIAIVVMIIIVVCDIILLIAILVFSYYC